MTVIDNSHNDNPQYMNRANASLECFSKLTEIVVIVFLHKVATKINVALYDIVGEFALNCPIWCSLRASITQVAMWSVL